MATLANKHDCLLLDLDGTLYRGGETTNGAAQSLREAPGRKLFVTNNAARRPEEVAGHLGELGFDAVADDVATAAQSAARLLAEQLAAGAKVLVVGTEALADEVAAVGLRPVRETTPDTAAVVQGLSFATDWSDLAEATLAIRAGALWIAANPDRTIPTERGLVPCNGSMVAALQAATEREPQIAGKPSPALIADAAAREDFRSPVMVGDRVDTDIQGANAAGVPSLMVLSGANTSLDLIRANPGQRPTYVGHDLRSLHLDETMLTVAPQDGWSVELGVNGLVAEAIVRTTGQRADGPDQDGLSVARAVAAAVWEAGIDCEAPGATLSIDAGDKAAEDALLQCGLIAADAAGEADDSNVTRAA